MRPGYMVEHWRDGTLGDIDWCVDDEVAKERTAARLTEKSWVRVFAVVEIYSCEPGVTGKPQVWRADGDDRKALIGMIKRQETRQK